MKVKIRTVLFKGIIILLFCVVLLISFVFNPSILYGNKATHQNFTIYHSKPLDRGFIQLVEHSFSQLTGSELFDEEITIEVCLNDGSIYPGLIETLLGPDVVRSFANKSVIHADSIDVSKNVFIISKWNENFKISQWLTHSFTHCLQFKRLGFFRSNPVAGYDEWKWEGYSEYTSFGTSYDLVTLIKKHLEPNNKFWVEMSDGSKTNNHHLKYLAMVKYAVEIRKMSYIQILKSKESEERMYNEMLSWYNVKRKIKTSNRNR